ncbi:dipeptidase, partial [bacterium]|nr:dipeptidase [bacterium]
EAKEEALVKFGKIKNAVEEKKSELVLVTNPSDVIQAYKEGKRVAMIGMENGYPVGEDLGSLNEFYDLGCRYMTLCHCGHNQICDSNVVLKEKDLRHHGLSDFGKKIVQRMNEIGMIIDVAHTHKKTVLQVAELTTKPIIASHAACDAICHNERNVDDDMMRAIKQTGGVLHIVGISYFIKDYEPEKLELIYSLREEFGFPREHFEFVFHFMAQPDDVQARFKEREAVINQKYPSASVVDYVNHIDHAVSVMGIDHVGISSDFFDQNYSLVGWEHAGKSLSITEELLKRGYSQKDIEKLWGMNLVRVWSANEI